MARSVAKTKELIQQARQLPPREQLVLAQSILEELQQRFERAEPRVQFLDLSLIHMAEEVAAFTAFVQRRGQPLKPDEKFIGGLTEEEYFSLTESEREALWDQLQADATRTLARKKEIEVDSSYRPAGQRRRPKTLRK
jgi:hypothetical protein